MKFSDSVKFTEAFRVPARTLLLCHNIMGNASLARRLLIPLGVRSPVNPDTLLPVVCGTRVT